uniref:Uncharacterized protein n=2 Tax=Avena sativa TaxID=4498 RepID=A0ACD5ZNI0_AVESA
MGQNVSGPNRSSPYQFWRLGSNPPLRSSPFTAAYSSIPSLAASNPSPSLAYSIPVSSAVATRRRRVLLRRAAAQGLRGDLRPARPRGPRAADELFDRRERDAPAPVAAPEMEIELQSSPGNKGVGTVISFSASHVKKKYEDAILPAHWKAFETVIFREQDDGLHASAKIAAFDFDGCLAKTSVKITGADKWSLQHKSIPDKLQSLYNDGYKLVIFTNESNIQRWKNKRQQAVDSKVGRLDNFIECVKVPIQVFIACGIGKGKATPDDQFRKPNSGMWWLMAEHFNSGIAIDMDQSFYVGDAAGRENDHSDADLEFAKAIGLKFHVPEEFFGP